MFDINILEMINIYEKELNFIQYVEKCWHVLDEKAKDVCVNDFDQMLITREELLEHIIKTGCVELKIKVDELDDILAKNEKVVSDIYNLNIESYLNIKHAI